MSSGPDTKIQEIMDKIKWDKEREAEKAKQTEMDRMASQQAEAREMDEYNEDLYVQRQ